MFLRRGLVSWSRMNPVPSSVQYSPTVALPASWSSLKSLLLISRFIQSSPSSGAIPMPKLTPLNSRSKASYCSFEIFKWTSSVSTEIYLGSYSAYAELRSVRRSSTARFVRTGPPELGTPTSIVFLDTVPVVRSRYPEHPAIPLTPTVMSPVRYLRREGITSRSAPRKKYLVPNLIDSRPVLTARRTAIRACELFYDTLFTYFWTVRPNDLAVHETAGLVSSKIASRSSNAVN